MGFAEVPCGFVIPAKAGIQVGRSRRSTNLGPGLRRGDDRLSIFRVIVVALLSTTAAGAGAFTFADGTTVECTAAGRKVIEIDAAPGSAVYKLGYTGITSQAGSGFQITWNTDKLKTLPPVVHDYIFFHECAHARIPTRDEVQANCEGLKDMRAAGRAGFAVESKLSAFYGVGSDYWARTLKCANADAAPPQAGNPPSN